MLTRFLALCACVLWASTALAQDKPRSGDRSDEVPRLDELLPRPSTPPSSTPPSSAPPPSTERRESRGEMRPSDRWGALAYTADGAFGAAYGIESKEVAERLAVEECRRESTDKNDCTRGVVTRQDSWFHIQFCQRSNDVYTHVTTARTLAETNQRAARFAQESKYGSNSCRMVPNGLFHSGGLHTKM